LCALTAGQREQGAAGARDKKAAQVLAGQRRVRDLGARKSSELIDSRMSSPVLLAE